MRRLGGTVAIALGITYLLIGVIFFVLPSGQQAAGTAALLESLAVDGTPLYLVWQWLFVLTGLLGLAVVGAFSQLFPQTRRAVVHWVSALGYLGFSAIIVEALNDISQVYRGAHEHFVQADEELQTVIIGDVAVSGLDAHGWVAFGMVGLWLLGVSVLALVDAAIPSLAAILGLVAGVGYWLVPTGAAADIDLLITIAAGLAILAAPVFYIWTGLRLRALEAADAP